MVDIQNFMDLFLHKLQKTFAERIWFVGLQGSYGRSEAKEDSDIDVVVILDELSFEDMKIYRALLDSLPHRELVCGFLSGKKELLQWEPSDLFQFYYDTLPIVGSLEEIFPVLDESASRRAIQIGACNLYHGCVHNLLHERSEEILKALYKSASFTLQAICFIQTGEYIRSKKELLPKLLSEDRKILETFLHIKEGGKISFETMSEDLFCWSKNWIMKTNP